MTQLLNAFSEDALALSLNERLLAALVVTLLCMGIVVCVLVVLMFFLKLMDKIFAFFNAKEERDKLHVENINSIPKEEVKPVVSHVTDSNDEEIVAAIIATLYNEFTKDGQPTFVVNKVKRKSDNKTMWQRESRMGS